MLVNAKHIKLTLNGQAILRDVSMRIEPGQIYGLLGPNGAGKSTSIAVLLGLYEPDGGDLRLFDQPGSDPLALRRRIGVMPELAGFYEWMSAKDYLAWYASFYGGLQQPIPELLRRVGLPDSGTKPIGQFSRGMQQRLALARALVNGPELLILDEPTSGLDPRGRREIHDLLLELAEDRQVGILLCTHLLDDVERLCQRMGIIDRGRTVAEGALPDLLGAERTGLRFRLRLAAVPPERRLPCGIELLHRDGEWWHFSVSAEAMAHLPGLWQDLIAHGWGYTEIHAESGGLETLYLRLTAPYGTSSALSLMGRTNMRSLRRALLGTVLLLGMGTAQAAAVGIDLLPDTANPTTPTMGDWLRFHSSIRNDGGAPIDGLVAWISLVEVTPGHEQPMDLEDWSALKAVSGVTLAPGAALGTVWPVRLIQSGDYRVVVSTTDRTGQAVHTSQTLEFHIAPKPVVESGRILPVACGVPLVLGGAMGYRGWRQRTLR